MTGEVALLVGAGGSGGSLLHLLIDVLAVRAAMLVVAVVAFVRVVRRPADSFGRGWVAKGAWLVAVFVLWWTLGRVDLPVGAVVSLVVVRSWRPTEAEVPWADER